MIRTRSSRWRILSLLLIILLACAPGARSAKKSPPPKRKQPPPLRRRTTAPPPPRRSPPPRHSPPPRLQQSPPQPLVFSYLNASTTYVFPGRFNCQGTPEVICPASALTPPSCAMMLDFPPLRVLNPCQATVVYRGVEVPSCSWAFINTITMNPMPGCTSSSDNCQAAESQGLDWVCYWSDGGTPYALRNPCEARMSGVDMPQPSSSTRRLAQQGEAGAVAPRSRGLARALLLARRLRGANATQSSDGAAGTGAGAAVNGTVSGTNSTDAAGGTNSNSTDVSAGAVGGTNTTNSTTPASGDGSSGSVSLQGGHVSYPCMFPLMCMPLPDFDPVCSYDGQILRNRSYARCSGIEPFCSCSEQACRDVCQACSTASDLDY